ncbi:DEAD/DEAH box helicase [Oryzibacter oryziterrae]|uniref:DEAD/DEAH box helicase n=1 Tax=Oryzibacter oryziterrae TaxID=2766474 RepID=UPI001F33F084|nr:DEAD/DEAH box helicase [Oryzibacter oryziterrae]
MPFTVTNPSLARALEAKSYVDPTPVQAAVIDPALSGRDMLVSAQTGSGKTVAFGLAIAATLLGDAEFFGAPARPLALIIAPTRELALQVQRELTWLYGETHARILPCVGGMDPRREKRGLAEGAHIVVGTPGRLRDHLERGALDLSDLRAVVLDEADEMLNLGFREDLQFILDTTPAERQTLLFSATIPSEIARLAKHYQRDAARIDVIDQRQAHADIDYRAIRVLPHEVEKAVVNVLRWFEAGAAIVFCGTREGVRHMHGALVERGFAVVAMSGEMGQNERNQALQAMRDGRARVCVATDVAARGIDLPDLGLVIHADLPHDPEVLLHRSGRTGRAGRKGTSVLLVPISRRRRADGLMAGAGIVANWSGPPMADEIHRQDQTRLLADPLLGEAIAEDDAELVASLVAQKSAEELAAALIRLYRAGMPEPEEITDPREKPERKTPAQASSERVAGGAWFRLSMGWKDNLDIRWLLPALSRAAKISKNRIGAIDIRDRETYFEVAQDVAAIVERAAAHPLENGAVMEPIPTPPMDVRKGPDARKAKPVGKSGPKEGKPYKPHKDKKDGKFRHG